MNKDIELCNRQAWSLFQPLLDCIRIHDVGSSPVIVKAKDFRSMIIKGMGRCIITVQRQHVSDGSKGFFTFIHHRRNIYILSIVLDDSLFTSSDHDFRVRRKAALLHEFTHCVATMMSIARMGKEPNAFIESLKQKLKETVSRTTSNDFELLIQAIGSLDGNPKYRDIPLLTDKHFRLGYEDFDGDYALLYLDFLFPYETVSVYFTDNEKSSIRSFNSQDDAEGLGKFLAQILEHIIDKESLDRGFALKKFMLYLPRLILDIL